MYSSLDTNNIKIWRTNKNLMFVRSQQLSACDKYILSYMIGQISAFHLIKIISLWYFVYDFMSLAKISLKRQAKNIFGQSCFRYQLYLQVITQGGGSVLTLILSMCQGLGLARSSLTDPCERPRTASPNSFCPMLLASSNSLILLVRA